MDLNNYNKTLPSDIKKGEAEGERGFFFPATKKKAYQEDFLDLLAFNLRSLSISFS